MASSSDYFSRVKKPIRGSSPTASLAADLSQNFHIDASPRFPTPRRSLFTSNLFGTVVDRETITTPPLLSSSPGLDERMDISPLPHKPAFQMEIDSPTPHHTEKTIASSPPRHSSGVTKPTFHNERKKGALLRPNLSRSKNYSTNSMPSRNNPADIPPFRFGPVSSKLSTTTSASLDECFSDSSPPNEPRPKSANSPLSGMNIPSRQKGSLSNMSSTRCNGSPVNHSRRTSNPLLRPRKQFRRATSMFECPGDVVQEKSASVLPSVMDIDEVHVPILPHFYPEGLPDTIPRISKETLLHVLDSKYDDEYDQRLIIDCRFEYEFEGGHIDGAVNYNDKELMTSQLFGTGLPGKTLLIFHCEYSAHRAPLMARHVRQQDRSSNADCYPKLTYPEVYILDGGYSAFFSAHQNRCFPQNYVEMDQKEHAHACERELGRLRQNRTKMGRAQTYSFGQAEDQRMEDSPTASNKLSGRDEELIDSSPMQFNDRSNTRRMISY